MGRHGNLSPLDAQDESYSENEESGSGQFVMDPDFSENGIAVAHQRRFTEPPPPGGQIIYTGPPAQQHCSECYAGVCDNSPRERTNVSGELCSDGTFK